MTFLVKGKKHHNVTFKRRGQMASEKPNLIPSANQGETQQNHQLNQTANEKSFFVYRPQYQPGTMSAQTAPANLTPPVFTELPVLRDFLQTESSRVQDATVHECLPFLSGKASGFTYNASGVPNLDRSRHIQFLHKSLKKLPAPYVAADSSRPWMFYWALAGLSTMGEDISEYRERLISTVRPIQNADGGFGGGNGQMSHLAPTYAIILSLAMVGGEEALDLIDRKAMWKWLGSLKQRDGGFQMSVGGEVDVR
jgi:protein farnesyltransferase subunit beta